MSTFAELGTQNVNADTVTGEEDSSQQTFVVPDYSHLNLPNSNPDFVPMNDDSPSEADFDNMSVQELTQYIDKRVQQGRANSIYGESKVIYTPNVLKAMWRAAGAIAKKVGYPCAGTLIEYSASGKNYTEWSRGGGLLASHIRKTTAYKRAKRNNAKSIAFTKSDSKDLFYALHLVSSNFHYTKKHPVHIHDKFDFKYMASYRSPFTAAVNNWAFLCSNIDVLYPSKINIYF